MLKKYIKGEIVVENRATNNAKNKLNEKLCFIGFFTIVALLLIQAFSSSLYGNMSRYII